MLCTKLDSCNESFETRDLISIICGRKLVTGAECVRK